MPTENRSSNTEQMVSVPRELLESIANPSNGFALVDSREQLRELLAQPATQQQGEPVAWVHMRNGEPDYDREIVISNTPGDISGDGDSWEPVYLHPPTSDGFSAGDMADQGAKAFRDGQRALTELNDDLREILGRPNFTCHNIANALRLMGRTIAKKSEEEQASVIHWMLGHYLQHGPDWRQHASDELKAASQAPE